MENIYSEHNGVNELLTKILFDVQGFTEHQIEHIKKLNQIGISLSAEHNREKLLEAILVQAKSFTNSDGGTLYMVSEDKKHLRFDVVQTDSLHIKMGGTHGTMTWPELPLYDENGNENRHMVAALAALSRELINIDDVYEAEHFNFDGTKKFDQSTGFRSRSMLVIPMKNHTGEVVGVLQLLNRQDKDGKVTVFTKEDEESTLSLASQAAMAITNLTLINELEELLESFIRSIASAIDSKSPYTGGHVRKVAELSILFANALNSADDGVYKDISYTDEQINEIRISALMHDIGKITTPEYVVDKATKLEAINDRIHSVRYKFEIVKRDLEIAFLKKEILEDEYLAKLEAIKDDFEFLELINLGGEFMSDDKVQRLKTVAQYMWNDNGELKPVLDDNEVYNLSIKAGTLTAEEREKINDHVVVTIKMLNALPFPKQLSRVAEIAGGHHEKINGKGYPLGLKGDELTLESRILAVADVFEALTAADRPYKPAKTMTEAMKIIGFMVKDGELDGDLVNFFYEKNLHLEYAKKELKASQIDIEEN
jgi:HD-GYP domain-containing protein (c-di-GMP phosphodiesterase class II)